MAAEEWWGVAEAASHCGIRPGTWRGKVARGLAPQPDDPDEDSPPERRRPRWKADTVRAYHANRPRKTGRPRRSPAMATATTYDVVFEIVEFNEPDGSEIARQVTDTDTGVAIDPADVRDIARNYIADHDTAVGPTVALNVYITEADGDETVAAYTIGGAQGPDERLTWDPDAREFATY